MVVLTNDAQHLIPKYHFKWLPNDVKTTPQRYFTIGPKSSPQQVRLFKILDIGIQFGARA